MYWVLLIVMLSVIFAEYCKSECHYCECRHSEYFDAEWQFAKCFKNGNPYAE